MDAISLSLFSLSHIPSLPPSPLPLSLHSSPLFGFHMHFIPFCAFGSWVSETVWFGLAGFGAFRRLILLPSFSSDLSVLSQTNINTYLPAHSTFEKENHLQHGGGNLPHSQQGGIIPCQEVGWDGELWPGWFVGAGAVTVRAKTAGIAWLYVCARARWHGNTQRVLGGRRGMDNNQPQALGTVHCSLGFGIPGA